jgi:Tol biopolymer transport system component
MSLNVAPSTDGLRRKGKRRNIPQVPARQGVATMTASKEPGQEGASAGAASDRLDSWKEIAAYMNREVRTVQRWEKTQLLPVHRLPHDKRGSVYAFPRELDEWMASRELAAGGNGRSSEGPTERESWPASERDGEAVAGAPRVTRIPEARRVGVILLLVVLLAAGLWAWRYFRAGEGSRHEHPIFDSVQISRVTEGGTTRHAAITPDGKYLVHVVEEAGQISFWARQIATGHEVQILPLSDQECWGMSITPDGNYVYAGMSDRNALEGELQVFSMFGGPVRKIVKDIDSPVGFSPDGKRIAFLRQDTAATPVQVFLVVANADGSNQKSLFQTESPHAISRGGMAWSLDGRRIAFGWGDLNENKMRLAAIDLATGKLSVLSTREWRGIGRVAWIDGGNSWVLQATDFDNSQQIWIVQGAEGKAKRLTTDLSQYNQTDLSLTADARTLLVVQEDIESHLWVIDPGGRLRQITSGNARHDGAAGLDWTKQGQIVYSTALWRGTGEVWIVDAEGLHPRPLTANGLVNQQPAAAADGNSIVFASTAADDTNIWSVNTDGSGLRRVSSGKWDDAPAISSDGKWVIYTSAPSGNSEIFKIPASGGKPETIVHERSALARVSPDGKLISYLSDTLDGPNSLIRLIPFNGGSPVKEFVLPAAFDVDFFSTPVQWAPEGTALTYAKEESGVSNLWNQPLDKGVPRQITKFTSELIYWFAWSRDGKRLALARGRKVGDAVLLRDDTQKP